MFIIKTPQGYFTNKKDELFTLDRESAEKYSQSELVHNIYEITNIIKENCESFNIDIEVF